MRCDEALALWQEVLLGAPVDQAQLEEAFQHMGACEALCAQTLGTALVDASRPLAEERPGWTDLYETLGLRDEEEGDAHARRWTRLKRAAEAGDEDAEAIAQERVLALAAWQAAAAHYQEGLRVAETAFLREGQKRIERKRLRVPSRPRPGAAVGSAAAQGAEEAQASPRRTARPPGESSGGAAPAPPHSGQAESAPPSVPSEQAREARHAIPLLTLAAEPHRPGQITVRNRPMNWQISAAAAGARLSIREEPAGYTPAAGPESGPEFLRALDQPHAQGMLTDFALALWATETAKGWKLQVLVRALSSQRPWTTLALTLEDAEGRSEPVEVLFARRGPQLSGWWARLRELPSGRYQLLLSASDASGEPIEPVQLAVQLVREE